jgi:hypothetical protein
MDNSTNPRQRNFVVGLITIGLMIIVFFGLRTARAFRQFQGHRPPPPFTTKTAETDVDLIRDWMTIPFISNMYHVRPHILFEALDIPEQGNREKSLKQLNEEYFPEGQGIVLEKVRVAILAAIAERPPQPLPGSPNTPVLP